jgi:hypothetical protein
MEVRMKGKRAVAVLLGVVMMFGSSMSVLAAEAENDNEQDEAVIYPSTRGAGYNFDTNIQKPGSSYGKAFTNSVDGTNWEVEDDDDGVDESTVADDENKTDINVWARVSDASAKIYKIDISWGSMKFEYVDGLGTWDVNTHTYTTVNTATVPHWINSYDTDEETEEEVGCNGTNNKIVVTNHSNNAIDAQFVYTMLNESGQAGAGGSAVTPFNDGGYGPSTAMDSPDYDYYLGKDDEYNTHEENDVIGQFYGSNAAAAEGHSGVFSTYDGDGTTTLQLNDTQTEMDFTATYDTITPTYLANNKLILPTAEGIGDADISSTWGQSSYQPDAADINLSTWNMTHWKSGARSGAVYFAFSGMPDKGQGAFLAAFEKVGTITVTITPDTTSDYNA